MPRYHVRRDIPNNTYVQVKSTDLPTCRAFLRSVKSKWDDLKNMPVSMGEEPYVTKLEKMKMTVTQDGKVVDMYVVEKV